MASTFMAIYFGPGALTSIGVEGRDEVEDPIDEALSEANIGEVTGGGGGTNGTNIDIEVWNEKDVEPALTMIRRVLQLFKVPASTVIKQYDPVEVIYSVYN